MMGCLFHPPAFGPGWGLALALIAATAAVTFLLTRRADSDRAIRVPR